MNIFPYFGDIFIKKILDKTYKMCIFGYNNLGKRVDNGLDIWDNGLGKITIALI
jgi:hypothetical protein